MSKIIFGLFSFFMLCQAWASSENPLFDKVDAFKEYSSRDDEVLIEDLKNSKSQRGPADGLMIYTKRKFDDVKNGIESGFFPKARRTAKDGAEIYFRRDFENHFCHLSNASYDELCSRKRAGIIGDGVKFYEIDVFPIAENGEREKNNYWQVYVIRVYDAGQVLGINGSLVYFNHRFNLKRFGINLHSMFIGRIQSEQGFVTRDDYNALSNAINFSKAYITHGVPGYDSDSRSVLMTNYDVINSIMRDVQGQ